MPKLICKFALGAIMGYLSAKSGWDLTTPQYWLIMIIVGVLVSEIETSK